MSQSNNPVTYRLYLTLTVFTSSFMQTVLNQGRHHDTQVGRIWDLLWSCSQPFRFFSYFPKVLQGSLSSTNMAVTQSKIRIDHITWQNKLSLIGIRTHDLSLGRVVKLATHSHVVPRLRMRRAMPPLPLYAGQTTLPLLLPLEGNEPRFFIYPTP
jgi:hypothetical protein